MKHNGFTYSFTEGLSIKTIVLYNSDLKFEEQLFTILHEFAYIFLNHRKETNFTEKQERDANEFACEVLAPSCILKRKVTGIDSLRENTNLPISFCEEHIEKISKRKISYYSSTSVINMMKFEDDRQREIDRKTEDDRLKKFYRGQKIKSELIKNELELQRLKKQNKNIKKIVGIACGIGVACLVLILVFNINKSTTSTSNQSIVLESNNKYISKKTGNAVPLLSTVYLTKTGKSFHLDLDCSYIKGKSNLTETTIEQLEDKYFSCSRCFK